MQTASQQRHVVAAAYLGWTLDAFDFFIMVFVLRNIAETFSTTITAVTGRDHADADAGDAGGRRMDFRPHG